jgi:hypothetical protein
MKNRVVRIKISDTKKEILGLAKNVSRSKRNEVVNSKVSELKILKSIEVV